MSLQKIKMLNYKYGHLLLLKRDRILTGTAFDQRANALEVKIEETLEKIFPAFSIRYNRYGKIPESVTEPYFPLTLFAEGKNISHKIK